MRLRISDWADVDGDLMAQSVHPSFVDHNGQSVRWPEGGEEGNENEEEEDDEGEENKRCDGVR